MDIIKNIMERIEKDESQPLRDRLAALDRCPLRMLEDSGMLTVQVDKLGPDGRWHMDDGIATALVRVDDPAKLATAWVENYLNMMKGPETAEKEKAEDYKVTVFYGLDEPVLEISPDHFSWEK